MKCRFTLLLLLIFCHTLYSQAPQAGLDSLKGVARAHGNDTLAVLALADLCYEYRFINQDSALKYGERGIALGKKLNYAHGMAQAYSDAAFVFYDRSDFAKAESYWTSALASRTSLNDRPRMASLQMKLGAVHFQKGQHDEALKFQMQALRIYEELKRPQGIGQALNNVAAVYEHQNHLDKALEYYQKAYTLHSEVRDTVQMGLSGINTGNIYFRKRNFREAKRYYKNAIPMLPEQYNAAGKAIAFNNLSEIYVLENKQDSALYFSETALALRRKTGDITGVISSLNMLGRIYTKSRLYPRAAAYLHEALDSAKRKGLLSEEGKVYMNMYELYRDKQEWQKALQAHVQYTVVKDSLLNNATRKQVADLQVAYDTEKKEQQILVQTAELAEKQGRIERDVVIIAALAVTLVLSAIIFMLLRNRQRRLDDIERKENEIRLREAYIQATIESQENERKRFARDLHDGMGQWISSLRLALSDIHGASTDAEKLDVLERAESIMKDINHEFRSIAFNLMPHTLIHYGLKSALEEMVTRLNASGSTVFHVTAFNVPDRLTEVQEISVYRVIQEWTNNILKYSSATKVEIQLTGHEDELVIMIEDNGRGFNVNDLTHGKGNGWKNINSRLNLIKGKVDIDSDPQREGTTLTLTIPKVDEVIVPISTK